MMLITPDHLAMVAELTSVEVPRSGEHYIGEASTEQTDLPSATTISHLLLCLMSSFDPQWN